MGSVESKTMASNPQLTMKETRMPPNENVDLNDPRKLQRILPGEIAGVDTWLQRVSDGETADLSIAAQRQVILFVIDGHGDAQSGGRQLELEPLSLFVPMPGAAAELRATTDMVILRIEMDLKPEETARLNPERYPLFQRYAACEKYRDYFKSEKTVSRTLVHPFTLPRFCMGSVETTGPDRIEPHAHPMLDQLFFSFANNNCSLLVDGSHFRFGGNNLLHIPLGSDHGIEAAEGDVVHYLWLDFFEDEAQQQYLVDVHKPVEG